MAENIQLNKNVFSKRQYQKTIDTSFSQLGVKSIQEEIDEQPTIQEFFNLYNELFYEIPEEGNTNSHEFLVKTSGDYIGFDGLNDEITALQNEIAQLREDLLDAQKENVEVHLLMFGKQLLLLDLENLKLKNHIGLVVKK